MGVECGVSVWGRVRGDNQLFGLRYQHDAGDRQ